jgi:hypothetical protein
MQRRPSEGTITVPVPDHAELAIGTLLSIIPQSAGLAPRSSHRSKPLPVPQTDRRPLASLKGSPWSSSLALYSAGVITVPLGIGPPSLRHHHRLR